MKIRKWLENLKKEKKRKKLVQAAKELEAKADPSLPKKRLPKNGVVKQFEEKEEDLSFLFLFVELSKYRNFWYQIDHDLKLIS